MEIVFVWLNNFRNLKNLQFNLGSDFIYQLDYIEDSRQCSISRSLNKNYVKELFKPFLNISAIVGENASGKSSILEALRQIIEKERDYIEYLMLFRDNTGKLFYNCFFGYDGICSVDPFRRPKNKKVAITSDGFEIERRKIDNGKTIFFSQILDLSIYPLDHDKPLGIDISSNWLSYEDMQNIPDNSSYKNLAYHKHCESLRQIEFCLEAANDETLKKIKSPTKMEINFVSSNYDTNYYNTNLNLREYDAIIIDRIEKEVYLDITDKERCFLYFLSDVIRCIYKNFEINGNQLKKTVTIGISEEEMRTLPIKDAVRNFLLKQDLFDGSHTVKLIESVEKSINKGSDHSNSQWTTNISKETTELLQQYDSFRSSLQMFSDFSFPHGFMSFDWQNMSTGEKAFLNLYSRFYYAKKLMLNNLQLNSSRDNGLPDTLYILIDEGEIGFHLQWQKEYIHNLINNIPPIIYLKEHPFRYQLIFSTHSPMSLSDIPKDRILYIRQGRAIQEKIKSFGANISDLFTHSFFIQDGLIGCFALKTINSTIGWLNDKEEKNNYHYHKSLIQNIDEPLVQRKLMEMYMDKMGEDINKDILSENIRQLISEYENIGGNINDLF